MDKEEHFLFIWRDALMKYGPESPTTRHVLITLSLHMNLDGGSCFPSVVRLAQETALSRRVVMEHIGNAVKDGWIKRNSRIFNDKRWRRNSYQAVIPKKVKKAVTEGDHVEEGGNPHAQGGHSERIKVVTEGDISPSKESKKNSKDDEVGFSFLGEKTSSSEYVTKEQISAFKQQLKQNSHSIANKESTQNRADRIAELQRQAGQIMSEDESPCTI